MARAGGTHERSPVPPLLDTGGYRLPPRAIRDRWNEYFRPLIFLTTPESFTLPLGLVSLRGLFGSGSVSVVLAGVVLSLLPVLILYILSQKYLVEGITATGIKG